MAKCGRCSNEIAEGKLICDFCMEALQQAHAAYMKAKKRAKELEKAIGDDTKSD